MCVGADGVTAEGRGVVESFGQPTGEPLWRSCDSDSKSASSVDVGVDRAVGSVQAAVVLHSRIGENVGIERPRHEYCYAEAERRDLAGHGFRPPLGCTFDGGIRGDRWHSAHTTLAGNHYDSTATGSAHSRQQGLGQCHRPEQVGSEEILPDVNVHLFDTTGCHNSRVVYNGVRGADCSFDALCGRLDRCPIGEVELNPDQPRVVWWCTSCLTEPFKTDVRSPHCPNHAPSEFV
ncbi:hypothetical protein A5625_15495 [Mycobacterium sp. 1465703.0]|nr:hypothetical protein A5625_15495 [Mycobacterium sp. 1465703.0]